MKARILIVEDEREIGDLISLYLRKEGLETLLVGTAEQAFAELARRAFDLIVLDMNLPGMDGFDFLRKLRPDNDIPVLIVSARDEDEDLVLGLGIGADEFVTKPFSPKVLAARVRAHLRRVQKDQHDRTSIEILNFGPFTLDLQGHLLEKDGVRVRLAHKEFELLRFLITNPGVTMSPEQIYSAVWGHEYGDLATVAVHIQRLRKHIELDPAQPKFIETIRGAGYRFNPAAIEADP